MYVREYFEEAARQLMNEMVKDIRSVFAEIIDELEWMDDETRGRAKGKSASMTTHIAYPDELLDDKKLIDLYQNVKFNSNISFLALFNDYIWNLADSWRDRLSTQCPQSHSFWHQLCFQEIAGTR